MSNVRRFKEDKCSGPLTMAELSKRIFCWEEVPVSSRDTARGQWISRYYCNNPNCNVRTVDILVKCTGGPDIKKCSCPSCGSSLTILADLESVVVMECDD